MTSPANQQCRGGSGGHLSEVAVYESFQPRECDWEILVFLLEGRLWKVVANPGGGGGVR